MSLKTFEFLSNRVAVLEKSYLILLIKNKTNASQFWIDL